MIEITDAVAARALAALYLDATTTEKLRSDYCQMEMPEDADYWTKRLAEIKTAIEELHEARSTPAAQAYRRSLG